MSPQPLANALELSDIRQQLLRLPPSKRVDQLISLPNAPEILKRLCPQDLLIALHACGISDSLELIEILPPEQVRGIIDLETWQRDRVDPRALAAWLSVLFSASAEGAMDQVMALDPELMTLFIKIHTRVYDLEEEPDPADVPELSVFTPDRRFLVTFVTPPNPEYGEEEDPTDAVGTEVARKIIDGLVRRDPFLAARYLASVRWELPSELEESSLRWRSGRLADLGYPDLYEAMGIYAPVDLSRPPKKRAADTIPDPDEPDTALALFVDEYRDASLFRQASDRLDAMALDRLRRQMTSLANRVSAAQALSPGDLEALADAVHLASATVNLGLEYLSRGDLDTAENWLVEGALVDIFRTGHTLLSQLGRRAQKVRERLLIDDNNSLLSNIAEEVFAALGEKTPRLFAGIMEPGQVGRRPFESLAQLARAAEFVAAEAFSSAVLLDVLGFDPKQSERLLEGSNRDNPGELNVNRILVTALCRASIGGDFEPTPLRQEELNAVHKLMIQGTEHVIDHCVATIGKHSLPHLPLAGAPTAEAVEARTRAWCDRTLEELGDELRDVRENPDPRFISVVLCQLAS